MLEFDTDVDILVLQVLYRVYASQPNQSNKIVIFYHLAYEMIYIYIFIVFLSIAFYFKVFINYIELFLFQNKYDEKKKLN